MTNSQNDAKYKTGTTVQNTEKQNKDLKKSPSEENECQDLTVINQSRRNIKPY